MLTITDGDVPKQGGSGGGGGGVELVLMAVRDLPE